MACQCEHISHFPEYQPQMAARGIKAAHEYGKADAHGHVGTATLYGNHAMCDACIDAGHMGAKRQGGAK